MKNVKITKIVAVFIALFLLMFNFGVFAFAAESDFEWIEKDGNAVIIKYVGTEKDVKVPDTLGGLTVTEIGSQAFAFCGIEKIELPDTIEKIGDGAFWQSYFTSFEIPPKVTEIAANTFRGCHLLENINLSDEIKSIGDSAFQDCNALTEIIIPDSVEKLGVAVFYSCRGLKSVVIPESISEIPIYTFFCCMELKDVKLHNGITSIGEAAFNQCLSLEKITLPSQLTEIGNNAFYKCSSLKEIVIPENVLSIGRGAFGDCGALSKITIKNPECQIFVYEYTDTITKTAVICADEGSVAQAHAEKYSITFELLQNVLPGDVDGNGTVNAADARIVLRIAAKLQIPTEEQKTAADIDCNDIVNAADARKVLRIAAKLD